MNMIAGCPRCSTELSLPAETAAEASLECPVCGAKFMRTDASARRLPQARVVAAPARESEPVRAAPQSFAASDNDVDPLANLSARLRSLQGSTAATLGEGHRSSMSRLLGDDGDQAEPTATEADAGDADEEPVSEADSTDHADDISAEIDALLKAAAEDASQSTPAEDKSPADRPRTQQVEPGAESPLDAVEATGPTHRTDDARAASEQSTPIGKADEPPANRSNAHATANEAAAATDDEDDRLQQLVSQFMVKPAPEPASTAGGTMAGRAPSPPLPAAGTMEFALPDFGAVDTDDRQDEAAGNGAAGVTIASASSPRRVRRRNPVRLLAGVAAFGAAGLLAGGYALLWIAGPQGDVLHLASVLPEGMLPETMRSPSGVEAPTSESLSSPDGAAGALAANLQDAGAAEPPLADESPSARDAAPLPTPRRDGAVAPAAATQAAAPQNFDMAAAVAANLGIARPNASEVTAAVEDAEAALPAFINGNLADKPAIARTGQAYMSLTRMIQQITLASADADANLMATQSILAKDAVLQATSAAERPDVLDQVASQWLNYPNRSNQGLILRGVVRDMEAVGEQTLYRLEAGQGEGVEPVMVLSPSAQLPLGAVVAVAGVIVPPGVEEAADVHSGDAPLVFARFSLLLESPTPPLPAAIHFR